MTNENTKKNIESTHLSIPKNYYDMSRAERRKFLRSVLSGISPNPTVREQASNPDSSKN